LVTKDQDLDLLRPLATQAQHDQLQHLTQDQISKDTTMPVSLVGAETHPSP
jgi:hypothetical protein